MSDLISAYLATDYVIFDEAGEIALRIGESNPQMAAMIASLGARNAVVITAWNPRSVATPRDENEARQTELEGLVRSYRTALAEGRGSIGDWPPEPSFCVFDLSAPEACRLANRFGQTAFVLVDESGLSWLVTRPSG